MPSHKMYLIIASLFMLTACSFKEAAPVKIYTLQVENVAPVSYSRYRNQTIKVAFPQTLKEKISDRMSYSYSNSERGFYQNSQWSNNLGKLLQGNFIQTLDRSRLFKAVLPYASTAGEDLRLESSIFDFSHHIRGDDSFAIVSIQFSLINTDTGKLIKTKRFSYKENTTTVDAKGYVDASSRAMESLSRDLVEWLR
jgi:cholesterol transport system auxiliary component